MCSVVPGEVRLVGGASPCAGRLEQNQQGHWGPVGDPTHDWDLTSAAVVCRQLDCGSAVSLRRTQTSLDTIPDFLDPDLLFFDLGSDEPSSLEITCSGQ